MNGNNMESLGDVLREIEHDSYQREDEQSDQTGVYIIIDDPNFETPQVSRREVDNSVARESLETSMTKQLIEGDLRSAFSEWKWNTVRK